MNVIRPSIFPPHVVAAFSTRRGGVSPPPLGMNLSFNVGDTSENVVMNRAIFFGGLGLTLDRLAIPGQVHSATVHAAEKPGPYPETDGLVSDTPNIFLCVSVADCVPILLYDPMLRGVAAVHAGWRGTGSRIASGAVQKMMKEFGTNPRDLLAHVGPSAGSCCYAVGEEVASRFPDEFVSRKDSSLYVDLKQTNRHQLLEAGLLAERIEISPYCTISDSTLFHSHRREGSRSGRMMGVIGLTS